MSRYNCIILDPDMPSRMKLKQATTQVSDFGKVTPVGTFMDANNILTNADNHMDIIFVSSRFDNELIVNFINEAKKTKSGQDSAYILIMKALPQGGATLAQSLMMGGDSILCEPYSVDSMLEITRLAAKIKKERSDARERIAISLFINDIVNQIDVVACLKASGCEPGTSVKKLREMCNSLKNLSQEMQTYYLDSISEKFIEAKVPPKALTGAKKYGGVSSRVKRKMESKIIASMNKSAKAGA